MEFNNKRIKLGNGIYLNLIQTSKFKSNLLSYYFVRPLKREEVTKNSLVPLVLKRGTEALNTSIQIEKEFEEMYGANYSSAVNKRGERHIIRFTAEWANGEYLNNSELNFKVIDLLRSVIYNPYLEDGVFKKDYVNQEKENHRVRIESKINDKRSYAVNRCIEEMCKYEDFSIYPLGYVEDIDSIDEKNLYEQYIDLLNTSQIEIFYVGNYDDKIESHLISSNKIERENVAEIPRENVVVSVKQKNMINEKLDVNQGKIVIGYRTGIPFEDKLYNGLLIANDILGGGPNSKLFKNVREAESLAYYVSSTIIKYKSIMLVDGGIEFANYHKTVDIINKQLGLLKEGIFTDDDIEISKKSIKTSTESIGDSIFLISEFFLSQIIAKDKRSLEEMISDFNQVTREDIIKAASNITIDTIYFMNSSN
ncbi:insulinase family protein [Tissierella sp. Yu-01]|uniref:EF-P 5-aminopentanol modification-associated protein YfmF n=1 Tax=Tissierella sp. Yu-01 TaxID=3035694 RepID=UPI00240D211B|nr:insulinase family protein [Tissierella sp. Yu-01]WFA09621.1 insulinase family protein [Tissierella sp. Yu-01]